MIGERAWLALPRPAPVALVRAVLLPLSITIWCLHSLFGPGYVLQIDAVFGPRMPLSLSVSAPLVLVAHIVGGYWAGRLFLGLALFLCGFGPMVLLRRLTWLAQVPAGLLGMLNPFVYDRMVEGQFGVAAGVGAIFLWVAAWESLQDNPRLSSLVFAAMAGWLAVVLDEHTIGPILLLALTSLLWHRVWREPGRLLWGLGGFLLLVAALSYALPPFFLGHGNGTYYAVQHFSRADLLEFRSTPSPRYGLWVNLLGLYGFWAERLGRIPMVNAGAPWWPLPALILSALALTGAWVARQRSWLLATGLLGLLVAGSTATIPGQEAFLWLMQRLPLVGAYREPEKWSSLWLLAVVVLAAETVARVARGSRAAGWAPALAMVMVGATLLPAGAAALRELPATIRPVRYPTSWATAAAYLERYVPQGSPVLVLPWTLYEELPFTGNLLTANPAPVYFPGHLISPNDLQIPGAVTESHTPGNLTQLALKPLAPHCALARGLRRLGIHWIIVEPAPGNLQVASALQGCEFGVRSGRLPGLVVLSG